MRLQASHFKHNADLIICIPSQTQRSRLGMQQSQLGCSWGWRGSSYFEDWRKCTLSFTVHGSNSQPGIRDKKNYMSNLERVSYLPVRGLQRKHDGSSWLGSVNKDRSRIRVCQSCLELEGARSLGITSPVSGLLKCHNQKGLHAVRFNGNSAGRVGHRTRNRHVRAEHDSRRERT